MANGGLSETKPSAATFFTALLEFSLYSLEVCPSDTTQLGRPLSMHPAKTDMQGRSEMEQGLCVWLGPCALTGPILGTQQGRFFVDVSLSFTL